MELFLSLLAVGVVFLHLYIYSPSLIGAAGERRVSATLSTKLNDSDYIFVNDIILPTKEGTTQIDHIVLSRFGIFVIETKNMSGWIFGGERQACWTQVMRRHKSKFQNPLRQNYLHVKVVQNLLDVEPSQIENLIAFVGSAEPKTEMPPNVFWNKTALYKYLASQRTVLFTDDQLRDFAYKLQSSALEANKETRRRHKKHVREKKHPKGN